MMNEDNLQELGSVADMVDNILHGPAVSNELLVEIYRLEMLQMRDRLRQIYIAEAGYDPWDVGQGG